MLTHGMRVVLAAALSLEIGVLLALLGAFSVKPVSRESLLNVCSSEICQTEASRIVQQVAPDLLLSCEDFYGFVCGTDNRATDPIVALMETARQQIIALYKQPSYPREHSMVKAMKKLFRACLNQNEADIMASVDKIKEDLAWAGGWPVLQGARWNATRFDWQQATYRFRKMGYYFTAFFNLSVVQHPLTPDKQVLKISLPKFNLLHTKKLVDSAKLLGVNEAYALSEMIETYQRVFSALDNKNFHFSEENNSDLENREQYISNDFRNLVNSIIEPVSHFIKNRTIIFPPPAILDSWLNAISTLSKRTQANFMMWKVLEDIVLNMYFQKGVMDNQMLKETGCLYKLNNKFRMVPNPVDVLYVRSFLSANKLESVKKLVTAVKNIFLNYLQQSAWLDKHDKIRLLKIMQHAAANMVIGAPEPFFHGTFLDELIVDMSETNDDNYLTLWLQLTRNFQSFDYKLVKKSKKAVEKLRWNLLATTEEILKNYVMNNIELPATLLQGDFFNEQRPNYLNYGSLGTFLAAEFANKFIQVLFYNKGNPFSVKTFQKLLEARQCLLQQVMDSLNVNGAWNEWDFEMMISMLSTNISYIAYQKWTETNGVEPVLGSVPYTNEQLFWISAGSFYCHAALPPSSTIRNWYSFLVASIGFNNWRYAEDFECPPRSKMNPTQKCHVF